MENYLKNEKYYNLIISACKIREMAYTPYSHYKVGAALLAKDGKVFTGCNIENGSFSPTTCAERHAIHDAIKNGEKGFDAIAVVAGNENNTLLDFASPCGVCRQVMAEFCDDDFKIFLPQVELNSDPIKILDMKVFTLDEILPFHFHLD